jgi:hypothetical protein
MSSVSCSGYAPVNSLSFGRTQFLDFPPRAGAKFAGLTPREASDILEKVKRARAKLDKLSTHSMHYIKGAQNENRKCDRLHREEEL